jgi:rRNA processing protein Gar1
VKEAGEVLHVAGSGRIIFKMSGSLDEGDILCDRQGARIAKVMELIGPVAGPYASAMRLTNNTRNITGRKLFSPETAPAGRRRR